MEEDRTVDPAGVSLRRPSHRGPAFLLPVQAESDCHLLGPGLSCSRQAGGSKGRVGVGYAVVVCFSGHPGSRFGGWMGKRKAHGVGKCPMSLAGQLHGNTVELGQE